MVKIRKPKKDNKEIIPLENPEIIGESISKYRIERATRQSPDI